MPNAVRYACNMPKLYFSGFLLAKMRKMTGIVMKPCTNRPASTVTEYLK